MAQVVRALSAMLIEFLDLGLATTIVVAGICGRVPAGGIFLSVFLFLSLFLSNN